jgi:hypothetical protein
MSLILNGTNGVSDVDGSASTPAVRGTDTNTGIFFPAADTIAFAEGGAEVARFDSSGNLGIGVTADSSNKLQVNGDIGLTWATDKFIGMKFGSGGSYKIGLMLKDSTRECKVWSQSVDSDDKISFYTGSTPSERMRIDSSGNLLVGTTETISGFFGSKIQVACGNNNGINIQTTTTASNAGINIWNATDSGTRGLVNFYTNTSRSLKGSISSDGSTVSYNTTSDYRLKENVVPMTGALAVVGQLKPCIYTWKADGSDGQGFIAHELAEVVPECVTGEKDAVDAEGNPQYQGIDTSFLVATLTAAIQEQQAIIETLKTRIEALEVSGANASGASVTQEQV